MNRIKTTELRAVGVLALAFATLLMAGPKARGADVRLRLVRSDAPDQKVSTAITHIDVEAERAAARAEREAAQAADRSKGGAEAPEDKEIKPRAEFDRYCNYMRGITIDGKYPFHRSYKGSYLGRGDEITLSLPDGEHRIDPGEHLFRVNGGEITTDDPSMRVRDGVLEIILYPVAIIAIDGSAVRAVPAEVLRLPVSPRLYWGDESVLPKEELVAGNATFRRLTLYMMADTKKGYRIVPSERRFHLTPEGLVLLDEEGKPSTDRGVYTEGRFTIVLPQMSVPVTIRGEGVSARIAGPAGQFSGTARTAEEFESVFYAFGAGGGANVRFGHRGENGPFLFRGDLGRYPRRKLLFDATASETNEPRMLAVSLPGGSVQAGGALRMRVEVRDAIDAGTVTPFEVSAFLLKNPLLREDATLEGSPGR